MLMSERKTAMKITFRRAFVASLQSSLAIGAGLLALSFVVTGAASAAEPDGAETRADLSTGTKFSTVKKAVDQVTSKAGDKPESMTEASVDIKSETKSETNSEAKSEVRADLTPALTSEQATAAAAYAAREAKRQAAAAQAEALHNEALDHYELARVYLGQWNAEMAELELQAAVMCEPGIKAVHRDYVFVALMRANVMKAIAEAMMVVGLGEPIPLDESQKVKFKESACKAHYVKGIAAARETKWKDAITEFQWALSYQPNNARVSRSMAFAYASMGDFNKAEKEYAASFAMDPSDAFAHADLAFLMEKAGNTTKAMEQLEEAVRLQPNVAALRVDLAWLAESKGDLPRASAEFEEAVKLSPKHAALWTHLGKLFARQGLSGRAVDAYKAALDLDPEQQDAEQGLNLLEPPAKHANKA